MSISSVFNVPNLFPYRGTFEPLVLPSFVSADISSTFVTRSLFTALESPDEILDVMNDEFVTPHSGGYHRFLV